jgi:NAD(P)-dependent dehydrogenase (short-subunit alcohol dehydrogenase family)
MSDRLAGETALVTGASSGIGRAIALRFAEESAEVVVADVRRDPRQGGTPTDELIADATFLETDVSDPAAVEAAVDQTLATYGGLDVMVNNAGVYPGNQPVETVAEADYDRVLEVNLKGVYFGSQVAAEAMREAEDEGGAIVNISSIAGLVGFSGATVYAASKGGVTNLTRALAVELASDGIRVNAIDPGVIETAMTTQDANVVGSMTDQIPLGRDGRPEDVAAAALYLVSDDASYVTGHNLVVDGGYTAT